MEYLFIEYFIVPIIGAIIFTILSLFYFSKNPAMDIAVKAIILAALLMLACICLLPVAPMTIKLL